MALGLSVIDDTTQLNFEGVSGMCEASDVSTQLNFDIRDYMEGTIIYKVLIDWMESYSVGDIFIVEN